MRRPLTPSIAVVAAVCFLVDVCAIGAMVLAPETVKQCGAGWILPGLMLIGLLTYGLVPLAIALCGVGIAAAIAALRAPERWLASAVFFTALAVASTSALAARYPVPSDPIRCVI